MLGAQPELGEQRPRLVLQQTAGRLEAGEECVGARERRTRLVELADDHSRTEMRVAGGEREPTERGVEQRGLAAAVGAEERDPLAVVDLEVDRTERERAPRDGRAGEPHDYRTPRGTLAIFMRRSQLSQGLSTALASSRSRARSVIFALAATCSLLLRRKCRMNLSVSPLFATFAAPCTDHRRCSLRAFAERRALSLILGVVLFGVTARGRLLGEVRGPAAGVLAGSVGVLVELEDGRDGAIEKGAVVRDDHRPSREVVVQEALEPVEPGEVEVVGGLVEQEHVEAGQQDRGQACPRRLSARQRRHLHVEDALRQPEVGDDGADAGVEIGGAEREDTRRARARTHRWRRPRDRTRRARGWRRRVPAPPRRHRCAARSTRAPSRPARRSGSWGR